MKRMVAGLVMAVLAATMFATAAAAKDTGYCCVVERPVKPEYDNSNCARSTKQQCDSLGWVYYPD